MLGASIALCNSPDDVRIIEHYSNTIITRPYRRSISPIEQLIPL